MFHQLEGLAIDEDITLADLQGVLLAVRARRCSARTREVRLRPGYFPFTEPSVEVDVSCFRCGGTGYRAAASAARTCKGEGWIEILGSGMVDPNVLGYVAENGYDPERVQGFAFGMGIERIAMLEHGVPDLRMLFENDVRLLEQFGRMRVPVAWLRSLLRPRPARPRSSPTRLTMAGVKLERLHRVGVGDAGGVRGRAGARGRAAPRRRPAQRLQGGRRLAASRARSSAARPTWPPARPWRWRCRAR